ncbi:elongator complex protein 2 [Planococcus citri]|uniref:elongator complex protein 2 n=1 Tax=Planococcus citri TaxID=170843 RepID=UPI0031F938DB
MLTCTPTYISGACNSNPFAADWGENDVICMSIGNGVAILQPKLEKGNPGRIKDIYFVHKGKVNGVKWVSKLHATDSQHLISFSVDKTAIVWNYDGHRCHSKYILEGHNDAVVDAAAINVLLPNKLECIFAATMTIDTLILWKKSQTDDNFIRLDTYNFTDVGFGASGLAFSILPGTQTLILGCPKKFINISLYICDLRLQSDSNYFKESIVLTGHTNWINHLAFAYTDDEKTLLLASSSHDNTIHIRRIQQKDRQEEQEAALGVQEFIMFAEEKRFCITIYSVLYGHDQWVYSLQWKHFENEEKDEDKLKLLSVSADKTAIVWHRDPSIDTWVENYRLGDVGGNVSGFLGGKFSPSGEFIAAHDLRGAFHVWKYNKENDSWSSETLPGGHFDEVADIQWDPRGQFLLSVSADKTTRLHAPWREDSSHWFEFSRPQTHGYSISCVTTLPHCRFISGATEKELRFFIAPKTFIQNFKYSSFLEDLDESKHPHKSALLPSLDLSNKPTDEVENINIDLTNCNGNEISVNGIPTEDELAQNTLWPEMQKLYYHPNEVSSMASSHDGTLIASACKATSAKHASVAVWKVKSWDKIEKIQELSFHQLTVTQLAFSPDNSRLLTVSRDRSWCLFKSNDHGVEPFETIAYTSKSNAIHKRQLQCCAWTHDSKYFATGSRDGKLVIWGYDAPEPDSSTNGYNSQHILTLNDENITSVSFAPVFVESDYCFAVGFDDGKIHLYRWNAENKSQCSHCLTLNGSMAHNKTVARVLFRPISSCNKNLLQLASSAADNLVRIYDLSWTK